MDVMCAFIQGALG